MRLVQAIRDFSSHILAERGLSPQTEYAYRHDLRQLGVASLLQVQPSQIARRVCQV